MSIEKHYTYIYLNPLKLGRFTYSNFISFLYEPFYVGEGSGRRCQRHLAESKKDNNRHKKNTIKKIQRNELQPLIIKVLINVSKQQAKDYEIDLIAKIGRFDKGLGPLTNMTDGGEGGNGNKLDLVGKSFNKLYVLEFKGINKNNQTEWLCRCECGNEKIIIGSRISKGNLKSCGCLAKIANKSHGMTRTPTHNSWNGMKRLNIKICERWSRFENFLEDIGEKPSIEYVLGRINMEGIFEPNNCKWMTKKESNNNTKRSKYLVVGGVRKTAKEWSEYTGICYHTIKNRIRYGWSDKEIVYGRS